MIMSDQGQALLKAVPVVFGKENHAYCLRHLAENYLQVAAKYDIQKKATKQLVREMLYIVAYATTHGEHNDAMQELRAYKPELAQWVTDNEPEQWAESKFKKESWGTM